MLILHDASRHETLSLAKIAQANKKNISLLELYGWPKRLIETFFGELNELLEMEWSAVEENLELFVFQLKMIIALNCDYRLFVNALDLGLEYQFQSMREKIFLESFKQLNIPKSKIITKKRKPKCDNVSLLPHDDFSVLKNKLLHSLSSESENNVSDKAFEIFRQLIKIPFSKNWDFLLEFMHIILTYNKKLQHIVFDVMRHLIEKSIIDAHSIILTFMHMLLTQNDNSMPPFLVECIHRLVKGCTTAKHLLMVKQFLELSLINGNNYDREVLNEFSACFFHKLEEFHKKIYKNKSEIKTKDLFYLQFDFNSLFSQKSLCNRFVIQYSIAEALLTTNTDYIALMLSIEGDTVFGSIYLVPGGISFIDRSIVSYKSINTLLFPAPKVLTAGDDNYIKYSKKIHKRGFEKLYANPFYKANQKGFYFYFDGEPEQICAHVIHNEICDENLNLTKIIRHHKAMSYEESNLWLKREIKSNAMNREMLELILTNCKFFHYIKKAQHQMQFIQDKLLWCEQDSPLLINTTWEELLCANSGRNKLSSLMINKIYQLAASNELLHYHYQIRYRIASLLVLVDDAVLNRKYQAVFDYYKKAFNFLVPGEAMYSVTLFKYANTCMRLGSNLKYYTDSCQHLINLLHDCISHSHDYDKIFFTKKNYAVTSELLPDLFSQWLNEFSDYVVSFHPCSFAYYYCIGLNIKMNKLKNAKKLLNRFETVGTEFFETHNLDSDVKYRKDMFDENYFVTMRKATKDVDRLDDLLFTDKLHYFLLEKATQCLQWCSCASPVFFKMRYKIDPKKKLKQTMLLETYKQEKTGNNYQFHNHRLLKRFNFEFETLICQSDKKQAIQRHSRANSI